MSLLLLLAGCKASNPLLQPDPTYPATWPAVVHLGADCTAINGTYADRGVLVPSWKGASAAEEPVSLSGLLIDTGDVSHQDDEARVEITVASQPDGDEEFVGATLHLAGKGGSEAQGARCANCIKGDLRLSAESEGGIPFVAGGIKTSELWLTKGEDGSLIICLREAYTGYVTVVPFYSSRRSWARFAPVAP